MANKAIAARQIFHQIRIAAQKYLVKRAPGTHSNDKKPLITNAHVFMK